jgi:hypothetical protein
MSEGNKKSLVERYYKWELSVLITSLLLIFWQVFGLNDATSLPLLDVKLRDPSKFPFVVSIILAVEFLFLLIEWKQSEEIARRTLASRFRFNTIVILAVAAIWINLPTLTKGTALAEVSRFWFVFYLIIGLAIGMLIFTLIDVTLMIRPEKGKISPLARIPVATKCVYMGCWPIVFALLILSYKVSCHAPLAVLQVAPWLIGLPISVIFVGELKDYFFFYDEEGRRVPFRQNISNRREIFKTHDYLYYLNRRGQELSEQIVSPSNATPQEEQQAIRQYFGKKQVNTGFPLNDAAYTGRQDAIEKLLANGEDINTQAGNGWTPLLAAVAQGYPKIVKFLLERGANPDVYNLQGITPLMFAARYGNLEIAKILLDYGAKLDLQNIDNETALAAAVRKGQEPLVRLFILKGAKTDSRDIDNLTPLEIAYKYGHGKIARLLRKVK